MSDVEQVQAGVVRSEAGNLIHFGPIVNGQVIPFASQRQGDYDEAVAAAAETQPQQGTEPPQQASE